MGDSGAAAVRVGIVTWNAEAYLGACLDALGPAFAGIDHEVVVVDNASDDATVAVAVERGVRVERQPGNVGYARAMNRALAGDAEILVALNPDTVPAPGTLAMLVERLRSDPTIGLVSPRLVGVDGHDQASAHRFPSIASAVAMHWVPGRLAGTRFADRWWTEHAPAVASDGVLDVDWTVGAVHVLRRAALREPQIYSERTFMYGEDLDCCWRIHAQGWRVVRDGSVAVVHVGSVAGRRAFGDRREPLVVAARLDWLAGARGRRYARALAAAEAVGLGGKLAIARVLAAAGPRRVRQRARGIVADVGPVLRVVAAGARGDIGVPAELAPRGAS